MKEIIINGKKSDKKYFHAEVKVKDSSERIIEGWASTRFEDRDYEIVDPDAIKQSLPSFEKNPIVLLNHNWDVPIGSMISGECNETGFYVRARIAKGTKAADETWALIEQGVLRAFSIGFMTKEYDHNERKITKLELLEFSVVTIPANAQALFSVAKGIRSGTDVIQLESQSKTKLRFEAFVKEFDYFMDMKERGVIPGNFLVTLDEKLKAYNSLVDSEIASDLLESQKQVEMLEIECECLELEVSIAKSGA